MWLTALWSMPPLFWEVPASLPDSKPSTGQKPHPPLSMQRREKEQVALCLVYQFSYPLSPEVGEGWPRSLGLSAPEINSLGCEPHHKALRAYPPWYLEHRPLTLCCHRYPEVLSCRDALKPQACIPKSSRDRRPISGAEVPAFHHCGLT